MFSLNCFIFIFYYYLIILFLANNQLINQVTGDYTATDYQNISLGITDLEARPMPMPQTGHVIDYSQYQLDPV